MIPLSILDLSLIREEGSAREALLDSAEVARHAEELGFHRYWIAEHHGMPGIASAATSVVVGYLAGKTSTIRVGAGGIMLPNHSPLVIAEQFGTLEALYPGRIDLGLGRAPGADRRTMQALRRGDDRAEQFPQDVQELIAYLKGRQTPTGITAVPGYDANVPIWLLGSSLFSAQLAAVLGLPFAFASHFAPQMMEQAIAVYRKEFMPSEHLQAPHVMLAANVTAADTMEEAEFLSSSRRLFLISLRQGETRRFPPPRSAEALAWPPEIHHQLDKVYSTSFVGTSESIAQEMKIFIERYRPDELLVTVPVYDQTARLHSLALTREAVQMASS